MVALLAIACAAGLLPQLFAQVQLASARLFNSDVRDYTAWLVLGAGVLGGALAVIVR